MFGMRAIFISHDVKIKLKKHACKKPCISSFHYLELRMERISWGLLATWWMDMRKCL
jgi:hypothetical protein